MPLNSIYWKDGKIVIIDQTKLPFELKYKELSDIDDVAEAIKNMRVRGAPLIGVTAALGLALVAYKNSNLSREKLLKKLKEAGQKLIKTRPTAINLFNAIDTILGDIEKIDNISEIVIKRALEMLNNDIEINKRMAEMGQEIIQDGDVILTHCNTGSLATVSMGTALGVIIEAFQRGKQITVYFTETRPRLQGARLTAFELINEGIDAYLISDTAVAHTMKSKGINKVIVGADRILSDGTVYNKIGTFQIAIVSKSLGAKFYVVAPVSTFDLKSNREDVTIEERGREEIISIYGCNIAPKNVNVYNPAFDETPPQFIDGIVTEYMLLRPPFKESIRRLFSNLWC